MRRSLTLLVVAAALATTAHAQTPEVELWSLDRCVLYAVEHSSATDIESVRGDINRQNYREAIAGLLPSLGGRVGANLGFGRSFDYDNNPIFTKSHSTSFDVSSGLTILGGLRKINTIRLAAINRATGRHNLDATRDAVAYATMEAYYNVVYFKQMVVLAAALVEESTLNLRQTERMEELGLKGFPDVAEMRAQEAAASYNLTMQKNLLAVGIILLKEQMNFPIDSTLDIAPLPANDPDNNPACAIVATSVTADQLYALALTHTPKALAAKSSAAASKMALQIARGARFPTVSVSAGFGTGFARAYGKAYTPFKYQLRNNVGYSIGASLNIPIFSGLSTTSAIARSRHQATIASIERDSALRSLYTEIEQAIADMNGSADAHTQALRQREATSVAHDVNRRKYDEGLASALELHTSTNRLAQARADELRSRLNYILKKRMVDYFAGTPLVPATN